MKDESETLNPVTENALHATMAALSSPKTVEEVMEMLSMTEKGQVRNTVSNAEAILSYDPLLRDGFRFNELTQTIDVVKPMGWERGSNGLVLSDNDINNVHLYVDRTYGIGSKALVEEALRIVANRNAYHPVRDFLNSLTWDGTPRVRYTARPDPAK